MADTKLANLINPEVMADMISAKVAKRIAVTPFATIDNTLQGRAGDTITVPQYAYIGDAEDVAEGATCPTAQLSATTTEAKVKKAMKAVTLTDEAVLSGYGNPLGETNNQLAKAIASKVDNDALDALFTATTTSIPGAQISYKTIVGAVDMFAEEIPQDKVMFVSPAQVTTLRLDPDFISADKYGSGTSVMVTGEIGMVAGCRIVPTRKVESVKVKIKDGKVDEVDGTDTDVYKCPIVQLTQDAETEEETPALTIYMKRGVNVETERDTLARKTHVSVDELYTAALSNQSKVVLAMFNVAAG